MVSSPVVRTDLVHGGRWTSLRAGDREWLWSRDEPRRAAVRPDDMFADAGGVEECVPTVRGVPDHGDAWTRVWSRTASGAATVVCPDFTLTRHLGPAAAPAGKAPAHVDYRLTAAPGYRFVWAAHALLDLSPRAVLHAPAGTPTRLFPEAAPLLDRPWPPGAPWIEGAWPTPCGLRLDALGPDDGTAVGAVLATPAATVEDGPDRLTFTLQAEGQPTSVALWRNLGGFPETDPYRSIGLEPMLGRVFDRAEAGEGDTAVVPPTGEVRWRLTITTSHRGHDVVPGRATEPAPHQEG